LLKKGPSLHQYHLEMTLVTVRQPTQPPMLQYHLESTVVTVDKAEAEAEAEQEQEQEQKQEQEDCLGYFRHS
jgi:hypothetical protein